MDGRNTRPTITAENSREAEIETGKGKGSGGAFSSSGTGGAIASDATAVGGAILDAGKETIKEAVVAGARSAVTSLLWIMQFAKLNSLLNYIDI